MMPCEVSNGVCVLSDGQQFVPTLTAKFTSHPNIDRWIERQEA
jgi:hypothetical protein